MDEAPAKSASPERLSPFHAVMKCDRRSWKALLSILMSPMVGD